MTYVAARRFGDRIIMIADTKIGNPTKVHRHARGKVNELDRSDYGNNYVPGRLKIFPLSLHLSLGYAAMSDKALGIIRTSVQRVGRINAASLIEELAASTTDGRVDFIVAHHAPEPTIIKIVNGFASSNQDSHWIGDPSAGLLLREEEAKTAKLYDNIGARDSLSGTFALYDEQVFTGSWATLLLTNPAITADVGGFPITLLASPHGHRFQCSGGAYNPDATIRGDGIWFNADGIEVEQFYGQYSFMPVDSSRRGAPVLGMFIQEMSTGFIYDPLKRNEAWHFSKVSSSDLNRMVDERSQELGGVQVA